MIFIFHSIVHVWEVINFLHDLQDTFPGCLVRTYEYKGCLVAELKNEEIDRTALASFVLSHTSIILEVV